MSSKGRHSGDGGSFYRDLVIMVLAILAVGALVFFLLFVFAGDTASITTTTSSTTTTSTSTTLGETSTSVVDTSSTTTTSTTIPVRANEDVRVVVLNSIGVAGVAGRFTQELADLGYQTLQADDYRPEQDPTRIWFREGFSAEANQLAQYMLEDSGTETLVEPLPDETLKPGADLIVVLGTGYQE
ncbi:MAG: LytR family transcriptional regulator [Actinobacteria bacterium]|nr:MAG: LytR family transcriptional regulator [Actinomycetota bacterium]REK38379.1 MAG: LytR family transcriptional regulator [Actinomycetota bacterium]